MSGIELVLMRLRSGAGVNFMQKHEGKVLLDALDLLRVELLSHVEATELEESLKPKAEISTRHPSSHCMLRAESPSYMPKHREDLLLHNDDFSRSLVAFSERAG